MLHYTVSNLRTVASDLAVEIPLFYDFDSDSKFVPLKAVLSLRKAGNMSVLKAYENRKRFFRYILRENAHVIALKQVHSKFVHVVEERIPVLEGDGLVSKESSFVLSVTVADCLPIWVVDKRNYSYGIVHSGWRGTGIVIEALELLRKRFGSLKEDIRVVIGPGIGSCCYSVDAERYDNFKQEFGIVSVEEFHGNLYLDLQMANVKLLKRYGIEDIVLISDCTYCNTTLSSFRREGREKFGTMVAVIAREKNFIF